MSVRLNLNFLSISRQSACAQRNDFSEQEWKLFFDKIKQWQLGIEECFKNPEDYTALQVAVVLQDAQKCRDLLLKQGHNPNESGSIGFPPLFFAILSKDYEIVQIFMTAKIKLDLNKEITFTNYPRVPLWVIAVVHQWSGLVVSALRSNLLDVNAEHSGLSLLAWAIRYHRPKHTKDLGMIIPEILAAQPRFNAITNLAAFGHFTNNCNMEIYPVFQKYTLQNLSAFLETFGTLKELDAWTFCYSFGHGFHDYFLEFTLDQARQFRTSAGESLLHIFAKFLFLEKIDKLLDWNFDAKVICQRGFTAYQMLKTFQPIKTMTHAKLKKADASLAKECDKIRLLGHQFSLQGPQFEGHFSRKLFLKQIPQSLQAYAQKANIDLKKVIEAFQSINAGGLQTIDYDWRQEDITLFDVVLSNHAAFGVLHGKLFYKIDCMNALERPGVHIYKVDKIAHGKLRQIAKVLSSFDKASEALRGYLYFHAVIDAELGLTPIGYVPKVQESGNCLWASAQGAVLSLFLDEKLQEESNYDQKAVDRALLQVNNTYLAWENYDCLIGLKSVDLGSAHWLQFPNLVDRSKIVPELILKALKRKSDEIMIYLLEEFSECKDWIDPTSHKTLARCLFDRQMFKAFQALASVQPNVVNEIAEIKYASVFVAMSLLKINQGKTTS